MELNDLFNNITNSAKKRFDYLEFEDVFLEAGGDLAENILFITIDRLADDVPQEIIVQEINNSLLAIQFIWEVKAIEAFVQEIATACTAEIKAMKLVADVFTKKTH